MNVVLAASRTHPKSAQVDVDENFKKVECLFDLDRDQVEQHILERKCDFIFGSSFEEELARNYDLSFVHVAIPNYHRTNLVPRPFCGYEGVLHLIQETFDAVEV